MLSSRVRSSKFWLISSSARMGAEGGLFGCGGPVVPEIGGVEGDVLDTFGTDCRRRIEWFGLWKGAGGLWGEDVAGEAAEGADRSGGFVGAAGGWESFPPSQLLRTPREPL